MNAGGGGLLECSLLAMHGSDSDHRAGQRKRAEQSLDRRDFIGPFVAVPALVSGAKALSMCAARRSRSCRSFVAKSCHRSPHDADLRRSSRRPTRRHGGGTQLRPRRGCGSSDRSWRRRLLRDRNQHDVRQAIQPDGGLHVAFRARPVQDVEQPALRRDRNGCSHLPHVTHAPPMSLWGSKRVTIRILVRAVRTEPLSVIHAPRCQSYPGGNLSDTGGIMRGTSASQGTAVARSTSALNKPLHTNLCRVAQCGRGLLCQVDQVARLKTALPPFMPPSIAS